MSVNKIIITILVERRPLLLGFPKDRRYSLSYTASIQLIPATLTRTSFHLNFASIASFGTRSQLLSRLERNDPLSLIVSQLYNDKALKVGVIINISCLGMTKITDAELVYTLGKGRRQSNDTQAANSKDIYHECVSIERFQYVLYHRTALWLSNRIRPSI